MNVKFVDLPASGCLIDFAPFPAPEPGTPSYIAQESQAKRFESLYKKLKSAPMNERLEAVAKASRTFVARLAKRQANFKFIENQATDHLWATRCAAKAICECIFWDHGNLAFVRWTTPKDAWRTVVRGTQRELGRYASPRPRRLRSACQSDSRAGRGD